jgi:hypothetical protein
VETDGVEGRFGQIPRQIAVTSPHPQKRDAGEKPVEVVDHVHETGDGEAEPKGRRPPIQAPFGDVHRQAQDGKRQPLFVRPAAIEGRRQGEVSDEQASQQQRPSEGGHQPKAL